MPRGPIPKSQIAKMQAARKTTAQDREKALAALADNAQFTHPKFWAKVAPEVQDAVVKAIKKAGRAAKKAEIARLQKKIEKLEAEI
jgi:TRAP-type C4-dicarboxylate transport system substrate-binding protein